MITLKDIKYDNKVCSKEIFEAIRHLVGALRGDVDEIIMSKSLMYPEGQDLDAPDKRVLDKGIGKQYGIKSSIVIQMTLTGLLREFYGEDKIIMLLPKVIKGKTTVDISGDLVLHYFIKPLVKSGYISDKYYLVIAPLFKNVELGYTPRTKQIGFIQSENKNEIELCNEKGQIELEEVLEAEIKQGYINKDIGDKNRGYSYSHSLRKAADYHMLQWSRRVTLSWNKINVVAASKGSGKSYYGALLCSIELFKEGRGFGGRKIRQIKYFVPDLSNVGSSIMDYMEGFLRDFTSQKLPNGKPIIEIQASKYTIKCNLTGATFKMISLYNFGTGATGEGLACDFAVIDEAAYMPDAFWTLFSQRALMETQSMYIVTTITKKTPRNHWFYRLLIDGELGDEMISSHRVDILQKRELYELNYKLGYDEFTEHDEGLMNKELDKIMDFTLTDLKESGLKEYYARAFCVLLDEKNVFNITGNIVEPITSPVEDYYVLGVDFGGNADPGGLVLVNITKHTQIESREMKGINYLSQVAEAKKYKDRYKNITIVGDATTIGRVIMQEDKEHVIDYWVQFVGQGEWSWNNKGFYVSSKTHMVGITNLLLDKGILKIQSDQHTLINQMKNFVKITGTKSLVAKFQGKGTSHDDMCLIGDTLITTIYGYKKLKDVCVGDKVLTPFGFRKVLASKCTGFKEVITIQSKNKILTGTYNHKLPIGGVENGQLEDVGYDSDISFLLFKNILLWRLKKSFILNEQNIDGCEQKSIIFLNQQQIKVGEMLKVYIEQYGKKDIERYIRVMLFIIKIIIHSITILITLTWLKVVNMVLIIGKKGLRMKSIEKNNGNISTISDEGQKNGIEVKNEKNGIKNIIKTVYEKLNIKNIFVCNVNKNSYLKYHTQNGAHENVDKDINQKHIENQKSLIENVNNVEKISYEQYKNKDVEINVSENTLKNIEKYTIEKNKQYVYNITVEDAHSYYANDILVYNCDCLMMCCFVIVTILGLRDQKELEEYGIEFDKEQQYEYNPNNYSQQSNGQFYSVSTY